jgi:co-chaperonin GroES (HSP10)
MSQFSANAMVRMRDIAESSSTPAECKKNLMKHLGAVKHEVLHSQVLVAQYIAPAKTKGGIILTDKKVQEDRYQGTIFLVIAMGKGAFKDDSIAKFNGDKLKTGDWVMAVAADGIAMDINSVPCRLYSDTRILMKVTDPALYY